MGFFVSKMYGWMERKGKEGKGREGKLPFACWNVSGASVAALNVGWRSMV